VTRARTTQNASPWFVPVDASGMLVNRSRPIVDSPWREAYEDLTRVYRRVAGAGLVSVYVRGSVALGTATPMISDLDSFAVVAQPATDRLADPLEDAARELATRHPAIAGFELQAVTLDELRSVPGRYDLRLFLKTMATRTWGEDLAAGLAPIAPGRWTAVHAPHIVTDVELAAGATEERRAELVAWAARRVVRAGFEPFAAEERGYTRELRLCADAFCRHVPDLAAPMSEVAEVALGRRSPKGPRPLELMRPLAHEIATAFEDRLMTTF
jgi:hypothetical protein